jgi:hypothetical protein
MLGVRAFKKHGPKDQRKAAETQLCQHRRGERQPVMRQAQARLNFLLPIIDVVLKFARKKLAHLGVKPVHIRRQRVDR